MCRDKVERATNDLLNVRATLDALSFAVLAQSVADEPLASNDRDAMIGAVEAMGWAVDRMAEAIDGE
ncbi:hypothetical protein PARPLA_01195 [Rhodobacteraceae bacterium THAF1]|uniref:hypothetical protein n=1 Tax=Palleronia sp. THAF1 TaxID=2587842 RepID=UPI000F3B1118|nr:hypothetical protein [Palleronia sp. THAF1]QFU07282.1 hypothetical protein FIU81_01205 [Palleronia sp. THAF1]VDC20806.1 hypothetical protein PARPLA_01195 [Rhodobacteraceae bacterium THAF1]